MHLVEILVPLRDNHGVPLPEERFIALRATLTDRFGGLTAFTRAPADGFWRNSGESLREDVVVFEVMVDELDRTWWSDFRRHLEERFRQEEVVIRAHAIERL